MLICNECGFEQEDGKFCGKCGGKLELDSLIAEETIAPVEINEEDIKDLNNDQLESGTIPEYTDALEYEPVLDTEKIAHSDEMIDLNIEPVEETVVDIEKPVTKELNQAEIDAEIKRQVELRIAEKFAKDEQMKKNIDEVKTKTNAYGEFFVDILKQPSKAIQLKEDKFNYALVSIFITLALIVSLFLGLIKNIFFDVSEFIMPIFLIMLVIMTIVILTTFIMSKFTYLRPNLKEVTTHYGNLLIPFTTVLLLAIIISLIGSKIVPFMMLYGVTLIVILLIPYQLINDYEAGNPKGGKRFYINIGTILSIIVALTFAFFIFGSAQIEKYVDMFNLFP